MKKLENGIGDLNRMWVKKTAYMWGFFVFLYFLCIFFGDFEIINIITNFVASYSPMIKGLKTSEVAYGKMGANYFSLIAISCPFFCFWIIFQDDVVARIYYGYSRIKRRAWEVFLLHYIVGIPVLSILVLLAIASPFGYSTAPGNFGQTVFYLMLNDKVGLLIFGSLAGMLFAQILIVLFWLMVFPVVNFLKNW